MISKLVYEYIVFARIFILISTVVASVVSTFFRLTAVMTQAGIIRLVLGPVSNASTRLTCDRQPAAHLYDLQV